MTACGFCVVAALSRYTSGFPWTFTARIGKSARILKTSNPAAFSCDSTEGDQFVAAFNQPPPSVFLSLHSRPLHSQARVCLVAVTAARLPPGTRAQQRNSCVLRIHRPRRKGT